MVWVPPEVDTDRRILVQLMWKISGNMGRTVEKADPEGEGRKPPKGVL